MISVDKRVTATPSRRGRREAAFMMLSVLNNRNICVSFRGFFFCQRVMISVEKRVTATPSNRGKRKTAFMLLSVLNNIFLIN
jgi:hypothetical protein